MAVRHKKHSSKLGKAKLKAKQLSKRMKAKTRSRRDRDVETVTETPISLRSKFAWVVIVLMIAIIIAACIRVHPRHYKVEYTITETDENYAMGTLDAAESRLRSVNLEWSAIQTGEGEYVWQADINPLSEAAVLEGNQRYVVIFDGTSVPQFVQTAAAEKPDDSTYVQTELEKCVASLAEYLDARGDCSYLQTDSELTGMPSRIGDVYIMSLADDGLYRAPDGGDSSWLTSPVAGSADRIFGGHLTYITDGDVDGTLGGRVGYALGVRYAEWHSFTRRGDRLFVNLKLDNAGITPIYQDVELVLSLMREREVYATMVQQCDMGALLTEPKDIEGYIDIPYNLKKGTYKLCVSVNAPESDVPLLELTMPNGQNGYYDLGSVFVK